MYIRICCFYFHTKIRSVTFGEACVYIYIYIYNFAYNKVLYLTDFVCYYINFLCLKFLVVGNSD
jgi:hypothetical protein